MNRLSAISKVEAMNQMSAELENWLALVIPVINEKLLNFSAGEYRLINDPDLGLDRLSSGAQRRAIEEIKAIYGSSGWKVERNYGDQRDPGSWITFS